MRDYQVIGPANLLETILLSFTPWRCHEVRPPRIPANGSRATSTMDNYPDEIPIGSWLASFWRAVIHATGLRHP